MNALLKSARPYDVQRLRDEVNIIRGVEDFGAGAYSHAISLPSADQVPELYREHRNNLPFSGALDKCPYLRELFDGFATPKASFRLLRREPHSAYSLHDDRDKGSGVVRMQIPILTNDLAFLVIADDRCEARFPDAAQLERCRDAKGDIWFDVATLGRVFGDCLEVFRLECGYLYYFDTDQVHTLVNAGDEERITLAVDLVSNPWLADWMAASLTEPVPGARGWLPSSARWQWNALRFGILRNV